MKLDLVCTECGCNDITTKNNFCPVCKVFINWDDFVKNNFANFEVRVR